MRKWIVIGAALVLLLGGVYLGSPYYAIHSLRAAARDADTDKLEASVDFPAVRESLKSQFSATMMAKMQNDPEMRDNPFAGLGAMMIPAIIDRMIDSFVTPDGIAAMMRGQKPTDTVKVEDNPVVESSSAYVNLDRFRVRLHNKAKDEEGPTFLLERRGFATWKLIRVQMPADLFKDGK